ncbi:hypothetical protein BC937DRAFT_93875, partial [Endogone sp. FLAS-F59071]
MHFSQGYFFIRSRQNGKILDIKDGSSKVENFDNDNRSGKLVPERSICQYERKWIYKAQSQRWGYENGFIYCLANPDLVLDTRGGKDSDGAEIIVYDRKYEVNSYQMWESRGSKIKPKACLP